MLGMTTGFAGQYQLILTRPDGSVKETGWIDNVITDYGLNALGAELRDGNGNLIAYPQLCTYCRLGTGNSQPTTAQTVLDAQIVSRNYQSAGIIYPDDYPTQANNYTTLTYYDYVFPQGAVVGNISEVGVGLTQTGSDLFSRTLITAAGSPTTLSVTAIDQLSVRYKIKAVPTLTDTTGTFQISGVTYNFTCRMYLASFFTNGGDPFVGGRFASGNQWSAYTGTTLATFGSPTQVPGGSGIGSAVAQSVTAYVPNTFYRDTTFFTDTTQMNSPIDAGFFYFCGFNCIYKVLFEPSIPKDNTKTLSLTVRFSWGRA